MTMTRLVTAQCGIFAVADHVGDEEQHREEIEDPVGEDRADEQAGRAAALRQVARSTATRASSPIRPGRTAFASRPTENAEKTVRKRGCGGSSAWSIVSRQASARNSTERRLRPSATRPRSS